MKFEFNMLGNLCVYHGTTLAAVMQEGESPESVDEQDREYTLLLLRERGEDGTVKPREGTVLATGHEFEMVHELLAIAAGVVSDVCEGEDDEDEVEDTAETLENLAHLLGG
jgi:hypothetical protein